MVPENNDEPWDENSDDEDNDAAGGYDPTFAHLVQRGLATATCFASWRGPVRFPLRLGGNLTLLSLGRIEYVNPLYHNEKFIFPVGYRACRLVATPASKGAEVPHVMEIVKGEGASGPVFR